MIVKNKKKGFTLIELLVVIAIIGILSSVVLASLNSARKKSRDAKRVSDIKQVQLALEMYFDKNAKYPTSIGAMVTDGQIPSTPTDPLGSTAYNYGYYPTSGDPTTYHLGASFEENNSAGPLSSDKDCNSTSTTCPGGAAYTGGFTGADAGKCVSTDNGSYCYDVVP